MTPGEGIRIEELTELSHHSLIQYRLPTTGEIVPLLQIVPSKTDDGETSVGLAGTGGRVVSTVIHRVRDHTGKIPLVISYDWQRMCMAATIAVAVPTPIRRGAPQDQP